MKNNKIKQLLIIILLICNQFMATAQVSGGVQLVANQANSAGYADGDAFFAVVGVLHQQLFLTLV